jgi:hypothetical protein
MLNVPLAGDRLVLRIAAKTQDRKGFTKVLSQPSDPGGFRMDDVDYWSIRGTLAWQVSDRITNVTTLDRLVSDNNGSSYILNSLAPTGRAAARRSKSDDASPKLETPTTASPQPLPTVDPEKQHSQARPTVCRRRPLSE